MTTKISSIPLELENSFYFITQETAVGVADAVRAVCAATKDERERFGTAAQQQAIDSFGATAIARRLLAFWGNFP